MMKVFLIIVGLMLASSALTGKPRKITEQRGQFGKSGQVYIDPRFETHYVEIDEQYDCMDLYESYVEKVWSLIESDFPEVQVYGSVSCNWSGVGDTYFHFSHLIFVKIEGDRLKLKKVIDLIDGLEFGPVKVDPKMVVGAALTQKITVGLGELEEEGFLGFKDVLADFPGQTLRFKSIEEADRYIETTKPIIAQGVSSILKYIDGHFHESFIEALEHYLPLSNLIGFTLGPKFLLSTGEIQEPLRWGVQGKYDCGIESGEMCLPSNPHDSE